MISFIFYEVEVMKIKYILVLLLLSSSQILFAANIQKVTVNFDAPEKFTDFQSREMRSTKDQERLMTQLQKLINHSADKTLAQDLQLKITVKDVDIAGRFVYPGGSIDLRTNFYNNNTRAVRVVKDSDKASLDFDYELLDKNGSVLKQGHETLSTRNIKLNGRTRFKYKHSNFGYIMPKFDVWLKKL